MKEQIIKRFAELMQANPPLTEIKRLLDLALQQEDKMKDDGEELSYRNAKIIWYAILCKMAEQWKPTCPGQLKIASQLKRTLH